MVLIIIVVLVFCAALAAGGILLQSRLNQEKKMPFLSPLFYHIIFIFTFGFYGVWGQFLILAVAGSQLTPEVISSISVISILLGLPFLIFGWMMLIRFATESTGKRFKALYTTLFLIINFGIIIILGLSAGDKAYNEALPVIKYYYTTATSLSSVIAASVIMTSDFSFPSGKDRLLLSVVIISGAVLQSLVLLFIPDDVVMALVFVFLLFFFATSIPFFLTYKVRIRTKESTESIPCSPGMDGFCIEHEISPREAEIITEICNGLSNKEIADKLFITLQTVKDHTSRIYAKTNVRSRMQLMTLIRNLKS